MIASQYPLLQVNIFTFPGKALEEAEAVRQAFIDTLKQRAFDELGPLDVQLVGWRGIEGRDVMVEVRYEGASSLYELVTPDMVPRIIQSHLDEHRPVRRWVVGKDFEAYYEPQKMHVSELLGKIDPQCLEEYQDYDGYKALRSFYSQGFDSFLQKVVAAGFCEFNRTTSTPFGPTWCELRVEKQRPILVVNAAPPCAPGHLRDAAAGRRAPPGFRGHPAGGQHPPGRSGDRLPARRGHPGPGAPALLLGKVVAGQHPARRPRSPCDLEILSQ